MWQRLMSRKQELAILGIMLIGTSIAIKIVTVSHWIEIDWDATSYSPWAPILSLIGGFSYLAILKLRHTKFFNAPALWGTGLLWVSFGFLWLWMVVLRPMGW